MSAHHTSPAPLPTSLCYLNGDYTPLNEARISVLDRGFIFGDGVYDVLPAYGLRLFAAEEHLARLDRSLAALRIPNPLSPGEWVAIAERLMHSFADQTGQTDQLIYIQVSRGVAPRDHAMLPGLRPSVFVMTNALVAPSEAQRRDGVACVSADDFRWQRADIKSTSLLGAVMARQISVDAGATETVMFRDGYLSEAAACNVWVVKDGRVMGPPKNRLVLQGIRYGLIEGFSRELGLPFELRQIGREEVEQADELMLSSASKEVLPITTLDGKPVGSGLPGPVYAQLHQAYQRAKIQP